MEVYLNNMDLIYTSVTYAGENVDLSKVNQ